MERQILSELTTIRRLGTGEHGLANFARLLVAGLLVGAVLVVCSMLYVAARGGNPFNWSVPIRELLPKERHHVKKSLLNASEADRRRAGGGPRPRQADLRPVRARPDGL